jgi:hypothetical protein
MIVRAETKRAATAAVGKRPRQRDRFASDEEQSLESTAWAPRDADEHDGARDSPRRVLASVKDSARYAHRGGGGASAGTYVGRMNRPLRSSSKQSGASGSSAIGGTRATNEKAAPFAKPRQAASSLIERLHSTFVIATEVSTHAVAGAFGSWLQQHDRFGLRDRGGSTSHPSARSETGGESPRSRYQTSCCALGKQQQVRAHCSASRQLQPRLMHGNGTDVSFSARTGRGIPVARNR